MLTIRHEQMRVFREERWRAFLDEAIALACRHWKLTDGADLRLRTERWLQDGWNLGLRRGGDLLRFINVGLALGDNFLEQHTWAGAIARYTRLTPEVRLVLLVEATTDYLQGYEVA